MRPTLVKSLRIHRGEQGIFRDQAVTSKVTGSGGDVAVGVLHTGRLYSDELNDRGLTYHFPQTRRGMRDANETAALLACGYLGLPLFVVVKSANPRLRDVHLGWIHDDDPRSRTLLIGFGSPDEQRIVAAELGEFELFGKRALRRATRNARPSQWRFRFDVLKRYGPECAVCSISEKRLLHAAHLVPVACGGSDDPRNGLMLCHNHHRAFDEGFFRIDPESLAIVPTRVEFTYAMLKIERGSIAHLSEVPHPLALRWTWEQRMSRASRS